MDDDLDPDELVDLLRVRLRDADAVAPGELHSFKELMIDHADLIPDNWYWETLEELQAQGHVHEASTVRNGGDACARLSADGRYFLKHGRDRYEWDEGGEG